MIKVGSQYHRLAANLAFMPCTIFSRSGINWIFSYNLSGMSRTQRIQSFVFEPNIYFGTQSTTRRRTTVRISCRSTESKIFFLNQLFAVLNKCDRFNWLFIIDNCGVFIDFLICCAIINKSFVDMTSTTTQMEESAASPRPLSISDWWTGTVTARGLNEQCFKSLGSQYILTFDNIE